MQRDIETTIARLQPSRVIAKGRRIRDVDRLVRTYGGTAARWTKRSGTTFEVEGKRYEFHWYPHHGIGKQEIKLVPKP